MIASKSNEFEVTIADKTRKLYFKRPNQGELFKIDLKYKQIFSEALRARVMTESQTKKELKKCDAWGTVEDEKVAKLALDIANLQAVMNALKNDKAERQGIIELIGRISELRGELLELVGTKTSMLAHSAEGIANEQRMHKFVEICLFDSETSELVFDSNSQYQQFASDEAEALSEIYKQAFMYEYNNAELSTENMYPELTVLQDIAEQEKLEQEAAEAEKKKTAKKSQPRPKKTRKTKVK